MKKLLSFLGALSLIGTSASSVVACGGGGTQNANSDDDFDFNGAVKTLKQVATEVLNKYVLDHKTEFTQQINDSANAHKFFNESVFKKLKDRAEENPDGTYSVTLTSEEKANFQSDMSQIFVSDTLKTLLDTALSEYSGISTITKGLNGSVFDHIDFLGTENDKFQFSSLQDGDKVAAYQFGFTYNMGFNYVDINSGKKTTAYTDNSISLFNLLDNDSLQKYIDWSATVLPAQLFNYYGKTGDTNAQLGSQSKLHIFDTTLNKDHPDNVFSNFEKNMSDYLASQMKTDINESLSTILEDPKSYGFKDANNVSFEGKLQDGAPLNTDNYNLNYQFATGADYLHIQKLRMSGINNLSNVYTAIFSDYDYLIDNDGNVRTDNEAKTIFEKASEEYIAKNINSKPSIAGTVKPFDDSQFEENFNGFADTYSKAAGNDNREEVINYTQSLNDDEKNNAYAYGTINFDNILVEITGFTGHFQLSFTAPWVFSSTTKTRKQSFQMFFVTYARLRKLLDMKFFEDVKDIDDTSKTKNALITLATKFGDKTTDGDDWYDLFQPVRGEDKGQISTYYMEQSLKTSTSSKASDDRNDATHSNFKNWFEIHKDFIGLSDIEHINLRAENFSILWHDVQYRTKNNLTALESTTSHSGDLLWLVTNLGSAPIVFDNLPSGKSIELYRADGTKDTVSNPNDYINGYQFADNALLN